jgi:hypothetical protein
MDLRDRAVQRHDCNAPRSGHWMVAPLVPKAAISFQNGRGARLDNFSGDTRLAEPRCLTPIWVSRWTLDGSKPILARWRRVPIQRLEEPPA